ncbi:MAG TPA: hypothetical protein DEQ20_04315 [Desulfobulbaceae bacterium]|nr:MAG: hypothetical protein A2520_07575 [Deltaproteobacteria bacterium RIFOXYD12_FULL_53_23]HCC54138.1 hypothetical protein [Desulfobulbaceae bacterium]
MKKEEIVSRIKNGMKEACFHAINFSLCAKDIIKAEYFYTVFIANYLLPQIEWGGSTRVNVEHPTEDFCCNAFPYQSGGTGRNMNFRRGVGQNGKHHTPERKGKIDITITEKDISLCAIEVKGFNPAKALVEKDLRRNLQYFNMIDTGTGESLVEFAFFVSFHSYEWNSDPNSRTIKLQNRFDNYLKNLNTLKVTRTISESFLISHEESEPGQQHLFIGNIVVTERFS